MRQRSANGYERCSRRNASYLPLFGRLRRFLLVERYNLLELLSPVGLRPACHAPFSTRLPTHSGAVSQKLYQPSAALAPLSAYLRARRCVLVKPPQVLLVHVPSAALHGARPLCESPSGPPRSRWCFLRTAKVISLAASLPRALTHTPSLPSLCRREQRHLCQRYEHTARLHHRVHDRTPSEHPAVAGCHLGSSTLRVGSPASNVCVTAVRQGAGRGPRRRTRCSVGC